MTPTWWFRLSAEGNTMLLAVCADEPGTARAIAQDRAEASAPGIVTVEGPFHVDEFEPCASCTFRDACMGSAWGDGRRAGDTQKWTFERWSSVHTCKMCLEHVIDFHSGERAKQRNVAPDDCPRWGPNFGSAIDCEGCRVEREDIKRSNPRYGDACDAAVRLFVSMLDQRKTEKDGTANLGSRRAKQQAMGDLGTAWNPLPDLQAAAQAPKTQEDMDLATELIATLLTRVRGWTELNDEWLRARGDGLEESMEAMWGVEMIEGLYLAIRRHRDDPAALVREWSFIFTDKPPAHRAWTSTSEDELREILRGWEVAAREGLAGVVRMRPVR